MKKQLEEIMISVEQGEDALKEMSYLIKRVNELHGIATKHYDDVKYKVKNLRPTITARQPAGDSDMLRVLTYGEIEALRVEYTPQPSKAEKESIATQADLSAKHPSSVPNKSTIDRDVTPVPHAIDCRYENIDNMVGALIADGTLKKYAYREDGNALSFMKDVADFIRGVQYLKMVPLSSTFSKSTISTWMLVFHQLYLSKDGSKIEIAKDVKYPFGDNKHFTLKLVDWDTNNYAYDDSLNDMKLIHIAGIQSGTSTDYDVSVIICKPNGDVYMRYLQLTKMTVDTLCKLASNIKNIHTHSFLMSIIADIDKVEPTFKLVKPEVEKDTSSEVAKSSHKDRVGIFKHVRYSYESKGKYIDSSVLADEYKLLTSAVKKLMEVNDGYFKPAKPLLGDVGIIIAEHEADMLKCVYTSDKAATQGWRIQSLMKDGTNPICLFVFTNLYMMYYMNTYIDTNADDIVINVIGDKILESTNQTRLIVRYKDDSIDIIPCDTKDDNSKGKDVESLTRVAFCKDIKKVDGVECIINKCMSVTMKGETGEIVVKLHTLSDAHMKSLMACKSAPKKLYTFKPEDVVFKIGEKIDKK